MRRRQQHRVDRGIGEDGVEIIGQVEIMLGAKVLRARRGRARRRERFSAVRGRGGLDEIAAPAAEADNGAMDHLRLLDAGG